MAKTIQLKAEPRNAAGTTASKAVRKAGKVPAVIYGRHQEPQNLQLDAHALQLALGRGAGEHVLVNLEIAGGGTSLALIQDVQHHPVKRHIVHLDFHALKEDEVMHTTVPVIGFGEPVGVKTGGGLLVTPDEPEALAQGLLQVLTDPSLAAALSERGALGVRAHYSVDAMADAAEAAYANLKSIN